MPKFYRGDAIHFIVSPLFFTFLKGCFKIKAISELTGKEYEMEDVVWYGNALQAAQYYLWNCVPVDITVSPQTKRWAFAFTKEDHKKYIGRWNEQKYNKNMED